MTKEASSRSTNSDPEAISSGNQDQIDRHQFRSQPQNQARHQIQNRSRGTVPDASDDNAESVDESDESSRGIDESDGSLSEISESEDEAAPDPCANHPRRTLLTLPEEDRDLPEYEIIFAENEKAPAAATIETLRDSARRAKKLNQDIPHIDPRYSPFLHHLKENLRHFEIKIRGAKASRADNDNRRLLSVAEAGYYHRSAEQEVPHENDVKLSAAMPSYFFTHDIPKEHFNRLLRTDHIKVSDSRRRWINRLGDWKCSWQNYILDLMRTAMKGLVAIYGTGLFVTFSDAEIRRLLRDMFRRAPEAHATGMWAKQANAIDLLGSTDRAQMVLSKRGETPTGRALSTALSRRV
jgi:hypothetical protein